MNAQAPDREGGGQVTEAIAPRLTNEELLRRRQLLLFTNRDTEQRALAAAVKPDSQTRLLHLTGIAGIGKSTVLTAGEDYCRRHGIVCARVNLGGQRTPEAILVELFAQLAAIDSALPGGEVFTNGSFAQELARLMSVRSLVQSTESASQDTRAMAAGSYDPVRQGESAVVAERVLAEVAEIVGRGDAEFLFNPGEALTHALIKDVEAWHGGDSRVCLFFDQYEQVGASVDEWIRNSLFPGLSSALLVLGGRGQLAPGWTRWRPMTQEIAIEPLSNGDMRRLMEKAEVQDLALIRQIMDLAAGLPLAAGIAVDLLNETGGRLELGRVQGREVVKQLVDLFLADVPQDLVTWVQRAAIVRSFNEDTLLQMATDPGFDPTPVFEHLARLSITQLHARGLAIHDAVRAFLNEELKVRAPTKYTNLHHRAYEYYSLLLASGLSAEEQRELQIEQLYHQIRYDSDAGLVAIRELIESTTLLSQLELSEAVLSLTTDATWNETQALWVRYMDALVRQQRNTDNRGSAQILDEILTDPRCTDPELRVRAAAYLAMTTWYLGDFQKALHWAAVAIDTAQGVERATGFKHIAIEAKALTQDRMGQFAEAVDTQERLLKSARATGDKVAEAWSLNNLGYMKWHTGEWQEAVGHLNGARNSFEELRHPYGATYPQCHLALVYIACGRPDNARGLLQTTLELCRERGNREIEAKCLQNLSDYWLAVGDLRLAEAAAMEALNISKDHDLPFYECDTLRRLGEARLRLNADQARADFAAGGNLAAGMHAHYTLLRCRLGQAQAELIGGSVSPELRAALLDAARDSRHGYGELRSRVAVFTGKLSLADGAADAADLFVEALHAASTCNAVALERCAEAIVACCVDAGRLDLIDDVRERWTRDLAVPSTVTAVELARTRIGDLRPCLASEVVLGRARRTSR
ncbi:tetratricopeptide repeat protein [Streptomyces phaeochromogenes]|nr:tetratricopeptide repeat protein [Streptomyces phaeochromogenes]